MVQKKKKIDFSSQEFIYKKISILDLILLSLYLLSFKKKEVRFEELVVESFNNFPKVFNLRGFLEYPDSRKLDRPLRSLRSKKLIKGDPRKFFSLTNIGKKKAQEILKRFYQKTLL